MKKINDRFARFARFAYFAYFAPLVALPTFAACSLFLLTGCSSGSGSTVSAFPVTATPSASVLSSTIPSTSASGVTTVAAYDGLGKATITVFFLATIPSLGTAPAEYHLYRNDVLVAKFPADQVAPYQGQPSKVTFADAGRAAPITYQRVAADRSQLETVQSAGAGAFAADTPIIYRVTLLGKPDASSNYEEVPIARSNSITPYR